MIELRCMAIGLWREKVGLTNQHSVRVKYTNTKELEIPERPPYGIVRISQSFV